MDKPEQIALEALRDLGEGVSPRPWGKSMMGVTVDAKGEPVSLVYIRNEAFGVVAVNSIDAAMAALEAIEEDAPAAGGVWARRKARTTLAAIRKAARKALK